MFAIVEVASRQYKLSKGETFYVAFSCKGKKEITLDKVLMTVSGNDIAVGSPYLKDVKVVCDVIGEKKGEKIIAYKFKRRKNYHKKIGFRQILTGLKVKEIMAAQ